VFRRVIFTILSIIVIRTTPLLAQRPADSVYYVDSLVPSVMRIEHKPFRAGVSLNYGWNRLSDSDSLTLLMSHGCDSAYESGNGKSIHGGLHVEYPMWGDASPFSLMFGLGYRHIVGSVPYNSQYTYRDSIAKIIKYAPVRTEIEHRSIGVSLSAGVAIEPINGLRFTVLPELEYFFYKKYDKKQFIEAFRFPETESNERTLAEDSLTINARTFNAAIRSTIGYEVPLSSKLYAEPQIGIMLPLFGVTPYWYAWRFEAGISLHFDLTPRFETIEVFNSIKVPRYVERQKPALVKPKLTASIRAIGISREGVESPVVRMSIEEVRSRNAYPVLTYVFFDENMSNIPSRYVRYSSAAEAQRDFKGATTRENLKPLELYTEVLNVLGSRLKSNRNATVRLVGSVANTGAEAGKIQLARARAESVKEYLVKVWSIATDRITIEAKLDPEKPSPNNTEQGREENRRVEFVVSDEQITDPVTVLNIERLATPDHVKFLPSIEADTNEVKIKSYRAAVLSGTRELVSLSSDPRFGSTKTWSVTEKDILQFKDSLQLRLEVEDDSGYVYIAYGSLPISVGKSTTDKPERIERFSLILFDFDQSKIESKNERMIQRVATALPTLKAERITIVGHTDESGSEEYNDKLSKTRAEEARLALERAATQAGITLPTRILTDGLGSRERLFDNSLPEGRFYSRTVNITVEKRQ
jgi:outer membrane protein OmpA-like peptidoglycan-associated protein